MLVQYVMEKTKRRTKVMDEGRDLEQPVRHTENVKIPCSDPGCKPGPAARVGWLERLARLTARTGWISASKLTAVDQCLVVRQCYTSVC